MTDAENEIRTEIIEALARGYCYPENENKEVDAELIFAMREEVWKIFPR